MVTKKKTDKNLSFYKIFSENQKPSRKSKNTTNRLIEFYKRRLYVLINKYYNST